MAEAKRDVRLIFLEASEKATPAARAAYLDHACAGDAALRERVEALLKAHDASGRFLSDAPDATSAHGPSPAMDETRTVQLQAPAEGAPTIIAGKYKLIEKIGEGGMGEVWVAEQREPVKRTVAVKLIKAGMDTKAVLARFEAERQALALMDHPNIAKVLDGGEASSSHPGVTPLPFFVMELVRGIPITKFCDQRKLTLRQRLELFVPVCHAIQHAHQKGIIHRDIKPSNVLVAMYDDVPVPKVIDFGIAKATGQQLTNQTLHTGFGAVVGTPEYMSPEQASFNQLDIDTRSDVYTLGILLYELLTGSTPFTRRELEQAGLLEILRVIREEEPPRPSTKLSTAGGLPSIAANRGIEPNKLMGMMRGELDWIVMKALEKNRNRRYDSANHLAVDIQRYLADEIVEARPPSRSYRLGKFLRKHRASVMAGALVFVALLIGLLGTAYGWLEAQSQRDRAEQALHAEAAQRRFAEEQQREAIRQRERAETGQHEALQQRMLAEAASNAERQQRQVAEQARIQAEQARGAEAKQRELAQQREKEAETQRAEAEKRRREAEEQRKLVVAERDKATKSAEEAQRASKRAEAVTEFLAKDLLAQADPFQNPVGDKLTVRELLDRAAVKLEVAREPLTPEVETSIRSILGETYFGLGLDKVAEKHLRRALELSRKVYGADHATTLDIMNQLSLVLRGLLKNKEAEELIQQVIQIRAKTKGLKDPKTLEAKNSLAILLKDRGQTAEAEKLFREIVPASREVLGEDAEETLMAVLNLAWVLRDQSDLNRSEEAAKLLREYWPRFERVWGDDKPGMIIAHNGMSLVLSDLGMYDEAEQHARKVLEKGPRVLGEKSDVVRAARNNLALVYLELNRNAEAEIILRELLKDELSLDTDRRSLSRTEYNLGLALHRQGKHTEGRDLIESVRKQMLKTVGAKHPELIMIRGQLAEVLMANGEFSAAEKLVRENMAILRASSDRDALRELTLVQMDLGKILMLQKKFTEAEAPLREAYITLGRFARNGAYYFDSQSLLGACLAGQKKYAEAEPLLKAGYENLRRVEKEIPLRARYAIIEAGERLISLYVAWNKPEAVKEWRNKLPPELAPFPRTK